VVEDAFEGGVFESGSVDVSGDPVVVEYRRSDLFVEHVISGTSQTRVLPPTLPDELEEVIHAGKDIVHEDDRVEDLPIVVSKFV